MSSYGDAPATSAIFVSKLLPPWVPQRPSTRTGFVADAGAEQTAMASKADVSQDSFLRVLRPFPPPSSLFHHAADAFPPLFAYPSFPLLAPQTPLDVHEQQQRGQHAHQPVPIPTSTPAGLTPVPGTEHAARQPG